MIWALGGTERGNICYLFSVSNTLGGEGNREWEVTANGYKFLFKVMKIF